MVQALIALVSVLGLSNTCWYFYAKAQVSRLQKQLSDAQLHLDGLRQGVEQRDEAIKRLEGDLEKAGQSSKVSVTEINRLRELANACRDPEVVTNRLTAAMDALKRKK